MRLNRFAGFMRRTWALGFAGLALISNGQGIAQESAPPAAKAPLDLVDKEAGLEDKTETYAAILSAWEKASGATALAAMPRTWLFLQEEGGAYGAPSLLSLDRQPFEAYGWLRLAEPESIRLYIQVNASQKKSQIKAEELSARLKLYADLSRADGVVLKTSGASSGWAIYSAKKGFSQAQVTFDKGPDSLQLDVPVRWLVQKFGYDALVVGTSGKLLVLSKLKPLKRGAQGLVLMKSTEGIVADGEKEIGALVRVVYENDKYALAKVSLSKTSRDSVPKGSKVLFDQP